MHKNVYFAYAMLNYIDLFAGCGGISLGLYNTERWKGLFAIEKDAFAFSTLKHNLIDTHPHFDWPDWLSVQHHDIEEVIEDQKENLINLRGEVDLVVGGPPCQGFSFAGKRRSGDQRNTLLYQYLKFIEEVQPQTLLFENVKGFDVGFRKNADSKERGEAYSQILIRKLVELGYEGAGYRILNFKNYGVPQSRERVIVVASKKFAAVDFFTRLEESRLNFLRDKGIQDKVTIEQAISDLLKSNGTIESPDMKRFQAGKYVSDAAQSAYQKLMKNGHSPEVPDSHRFANHTTAIEEKFRIIIKEDLSSKQVMERFGTKKSRTKLLKAKEPSQTLTSLPDDYVHYKEPRILTVREYARIQSFNDWYEFKGKYTTGGFLRKVQVPRYTQLGNAVPPLFAELCGNILYNLLSDGK